MQSCVTVAPGALSGEIAAPPSKSEAHRALICAALSSGRSELRNYAECDDTAATRAALEALGLVRESARGGADLLSLEGGARPDGGRRTVRCGESGSTLRFLIPIALALGIPCRFIGEGRLLRRPLDPYLELMATQGITYVLCGDTLEIDGRFKTNRFALPGDISSQFVSGLLLALPLIGGGEIALTAPLRSSGYAAMTLSAMRRHGVEAREDGDAFRVPPGAGYRPAACRLAGDDSFAAFFLAAGAMGGGPVAVRGVETPSAQPDAAMRALLARSGAEIREAPGRVAASGGGGVRPFELDIGDTPDLGPALAALACAADGTSRITGASRLRLKESDRLAAMAEELAALGAPVEEGADFLVIHGAGRVRGGRCRSHGDHRIAMALAALSTIADTSITIEGADCVSKSAPTFWKDFKALGGDVT